MNITGWLRRARSQPILERRNANPYTDSIVRLILEQARGKAGESDANDTGALEASAALTARAFASANVKDADSIISDALTPDVLFGMAYRLVRCGEVVYAIDIVDGDLELQPASSWDISGGISKKTWEYRLTLSAPSGSIERRLPYQGVIHVLYTPSLTQPHVGSSPFQNAGITAKLSAEVNQALADESSLPRGAILPLPVQPDDDDDESPTSELEDAIGALRGKILTAETTQGGYGDAGNIPKGDYEAKRVGAQPPRELVELRRDADKAVFQVLGIPLELMFEADGSALREAWRRFQYATVVPLGMLVQSELRDKLDSPSLTLSWDALAASDIASRARAYGVLVSNGYDDDEAKQVTGLM